MFLATAASILNGQQQIDRQLPFTHTETSHQMQEIATVVRSVSLVPQVNLDASGRSISLRGERGQIETAEWLLGRLDRPTAQAGEYRVSGDEKEGVVKILAEPKLETVERLQEVAPILRATCDIRRMFTYYVHHAMIIRTSPEQVACGEWLLAKLLKSPEVFASPEFRLPFREGIVRVVPLKRPSTSAQFQELAVIVRSMSMLRWVFTLSAAPNARTPRSARAASLGRVAGGQAGSTGGPPDN